ncbi:MAG TPA: ATP-binding protein [Burkholderiaceae bacterium]|nr:ATP-binding protein [Burkholderiaceae bacterium]
MDMKLHTRLALVVIVGLMPILGLQVIEQADDAREREAQALLDVQRQAELVAGQIEQITARYRDLLVSVAASPTVRTRDEQACNAYLALLQQQFRDGFTIGAADLNGDVYCMGLPFPRERRINNADRSYFRDALHTKDFVVGELAYARGPGIPVLHFAYPMLESDGRPLGVVFASINLPWLARQLVDTPLPADARLFVADRRGTLLIELPDEGGIGRAMPKELRRLVQEGLPGNASVTGADGPELIAGYVPEAAHPRGISIVLTRPRDALLTPVWQQVLREAAMGLLAVALGLLLAFGVGRTKVYRPLARLTETALRWRKGDLSARTGLAGEADTELRELGSALDRMAEHLAQRQEELAAAHEEMRRSRDEAIRANHSKTQFLAAASHDLRQPLHAMNLNIALLSTRLGQTAEAAFVERLKRSVGSLAELLNALLDVSQLDAGMIRPHLASVELDGLVRTVVDEFSAAAAQRGLTLEAGVSHATVHTDPVLLGRMLRNLVSNAIKYTPSGGEVHIGFHAWGGRMDIAVSDTGEGIPPDQQQEVFEEFRQLGNPQRNPSLGLGLGLSIVKRMSALLDHPVRLESTPGEGTTVTVTVPLSVSTAAPLPENHVPLLQGRVVLVEDDEMVAESTADVLRSWGLTVDVVGSGEEAFQRLGSSAWVWDAVLADHRLPGRSGLDVLLEVRQSHPEAIVALLTGDPGDARVAQARRTGLAVLEKPVRLERLSELLAPMAPRPGAEPPHIRIASSR